MGMMKSWDLLTIWLALAGTRTGMGVGGNTVVEDRAALESGGPGSFRFSSFFGGGSAQPDTMYLILKADFVSSNQTNTSAPNEPILNVVEQLLTTGFPRGTFQLTWVANEQN